MVMEFQFGKMAKNTMDSLLTTKEKVKALSHGQMEDSIQENGKMENKMEEELILAKKDRKRWGNGKMAGKLDGQNDSYYTNKQRNIYHVVEYNFLFINI